MANWMPKALDDLDEITKFLEQNDVTLALYSEAEIKREVDRIEASILAGRNVPGKPDEYRIWRLMKGKYQLFYRILGPNSIEVLRVWPSRRRPLRPDEIE